MALEFNQETNFYSDYGLSHIPFFQTTWFWWLCFFVVALIVCGVIFFVGKKLYAWYVEKNKTPWGTAWEKLGGLEELCIMYPDKCDESYPVMLFILKKYLQDRFDILAVSKTSHEIISDIKNIGLSDDTLCEVKELLENSSDILFNQSPIELFEFRSDLEICFCVIQETIPKK